MSQDARNSLIAARCVTAFFAAMYLLMWLLPNVELPDWAPWAMLALNLLVIVVNIVRLHRKRRRRPSAKRLHASDLRPSYSLQRVRDGSGV